ncbi:2-succinyl-5-enolpyruvyl-6-hydroxy-3-cyclohexene-1-carboxylate synthase, partial [Xenorhabdus bovienii]|nr:2-succinyl-5-enolpyruvyl-6-hydroxy-3-cyclohexene-1-carboxylate synthase [Xenorhabdus bovienii]
WQKKCQPEQYWIVDPISGRLDPANHQGRKFTCRVADWLREHPAHLTRHPTHVSYSRFSWADELEIWSKKAFECTQTKLAGKF